MKYDIYLALGSNLGNREGHLEEAIGHISRIPETRLSAVSNIYETEPVGYTEQDRFLNMTAKICSDLEPSQMLEELQRVENILKRKREIRWGPRTIDIDILIYGNLEIDSDTLSVPHPRMFERAFVLIPLKDIYPEVRINGASLDELIGKCSDKDGVKLFKCFETNSSIPEI